MFHQSRTVSTSVKDTVSFYTFCLALYVDEFASSKYTLVPSFVPNFRFSLFLQIGNTVHLYLHSARPPLCVNQKCIYSNRFLLSGARATLSASCPRDRIKDYISPAQEHTQSQSSLLLYTTASAQFFTPLLFSFVYCKHLK